MISSPLPAQHSPTPFHQCWSPVVLEVCADPHHFQNRSKSAPRNHFHFLLLLILLLELRVIDPQDFPALVFLHLLSRFYHRRNCSISHQFSQPELNSIVLLNSRFFSSNFAFASFHSPVSPHRPKWCTHFLLFLPVILLEPSLFSVRNRCRNRRLPNLRNRLHHPSHMKITAPSF